MTAEILVQNKILDNKHIITFLSSEFDRSVSYQLFENILDQCNHDDLPVYIDLSQFKFVGSKFIGALISFKKRCTKPVFLINPSSSAFDIIKLTKLDTIFAILTTKPPCL